ncbi:MAG: TonB-dependent receptor plug domain-containing protein [Undibacterium sp.]|nr:TonB-dependent receptor plug domain-containing protein [Opitutaceae bacterium]
MTSHSFLPSRLRHPAFIPVALACALVALRAQTPSPVLQETPAAARPLTKAELDAAAAAAVANAADKAKNDAVVLSPFEVKSESDKGYYASNSLSGTRMNSRLEDLASPISVVTKQQLDDMAAVDLNDIFRSESNVEGFYQYTEFSVDNNRVIDTASNNPEANNRIRGMGQANVTAGGISVSNASAIDAYNIDAVEISRGANSNIFGIGSTSGTVNLSLAAANTTRDATKFTFMTDDRGRLRETFDINRVLWRNKLAVRVLGSHDDVGFIRGPSSQITKRFNIVTRFQPFKKTSLKLSYETVRNGQSLPNAMTPRQGITSWLANGGQTFDASTGTVYSSTGASLGTFSGLTTANLAGGANELASLYRFSGGLQAGSGAQRPVIGYIDGQIAFFTGGASWLYDRRDATTLNNTYNQGGTQRLVEYVIPGQQVNIPDINPATGKPFGLVNTVFSEQLSGVNGSDGKALYDWTKCNINASNYSERRTNVIRFELEQSVINTDKQQLAFQFAGLSEDIEAKSWNFIGNGGDGVDGIINIDPNRTLPNGAVNPGYLRPYLRSRQPQVYYRPEEKITLKAQGAYMVDFSRDKGLSRWLGRQNFLGYVEYSERKNIPNALRYRSQIADTSTLIRGTGNSDSLNTNYYLGDAKGYNVDSPTTRPPTDALVPYTYWSTEFGPNGTTAFDTAQWRTQQNTRLAEVLFSAQGSLKTENRTQGGIWQGFFLDGRIIPTIGYRQDKVRFAGNKPYDSTTLYPQYRYNIGSASYLEPTQAMFDFQNTYNPVNYRTGGTDNRGITRTAGVVVKPLPWLHFTYNQSDSLDPASQAVDTYGTLLDNPRGDSKDYGVRISMLNERLWFSLNKYEGTTTNARNGATGRVSARALPFDFDTGQLDVDNAYGASSGTEFDLFDWYFFRIYGDSSTPAGGTTRDPNFNGTGDAGYMTSKGLFGATAAETRQRVTDHVYSLMGFTKEAARQILNTPPGSTRTATNDVTSRGYEAELNFRTRYWNIKVTGAQKETIDSNIAESLVRYITTRQPILEKASYTNTATGVAESYWNTTSSGTTLTRGNSYAAQVLNVYNPLVQNAGKPRPQTRKYSFAATTSYNLAGVAGDNRILQNLRIGGGGSWASRAAIGTKYAAPEFDLSSNAYLVRKIDPSALYYDDPVFTANAFASYAFKMNKGRIRSSVQLNVQNVFENGHLQAVAVRTDGTPWAFRIVDPRLFQLTFNVEL